MQSEQGGLEPVQHRGAVIRSIRPEERDACVDLWCNVWPGEGNPAYFRRYFHSDVDWLPYYTQVAVLEDKIISAVHICRRVVACGDFQLTMGGIANVATLAEFRGDGFNSACLCRAIAVMEADAMDFSLLFTGINPYYERHGYAEWPRERLRGSIRSDFTPRPTTHQVRAATDADIAAIRHLYTGYNRVRPIAVQRTEAYWRDWIGRKPSQMSEPPLLALDADGEAVGYIFYQVNFYTGHQISEDYAYVTEIGIAPCADLQAVATALLDAVALRALSTGKRQLHLSLGVEAEGSGREDPICLALEGLLQTCQSNVNTSGMARLLHRDSLLRSFAMEMNERWTNAGRPGGKLTFHTPYGLTCLDADGPFLRVNPTEETYGRDALPQSALFGLLFGSLPPERATEDTALHPLLTALFPTQGTVYWGADGF